MNELIATFLDYLSVERGLSQNTIVSYRRDLGAYVNFLTRHSKDTFSKTDRNDIVDFMLFQKDRGLSPNSVSRSLAAIKVFYRFMVRERILKSDPTSLVESPKLWKKIPIYCSRYK